VCKEQFILMRCVLFSHMLQFSGSMMTFGFEVIPVDAAHKIIARDWPIKCDSVHQLLYFSVNGKHKYIYIYMYK